MIVCISVQEHMAIISEEDLKNPHIRHFDCLNPGWSKVTISTYDFKYILSTHPSDPTIQVKFDN